MKYPRASGALRWAPDPMLKRAYFAHMTLLCTVSNVGLSRSGACPPDQILDLPLYCKGYMVHPFNPSVLHAAATNKGAAASPIVSDSCVKGGEFEPHCWQVDSAFHP